MDRWKVFHREQGFATLVACILAPARLCSFVNLDCLLVPGAAGDKGVSRVSRCPQRPPEFCWVTPSVLSNYSKAHDRRPQDDPICRRIRIPHQNLRSADWRNLYDGLRLLSIRPIRKLIKLNSC